MLFICRIGLTFLLLGAVAGPAAAERSTQSYTISQLYSAAAPLPGVRFAKVYDRHAYIVTASYRVLPERLRFFWNDPVYGAQIRALLAEDYFLRDGRFAAYFAANLDNLGKASFFDAGFIMLQLRTPEQAVIVPVSIVTVQKAAAAVREALKSAPQLLQP